MGTNDLERRVALLKDISHKTGFELCTCCHQAIIFPTWWQKFIQQWKKKKQYHCMICQFLLSKHLIKE